MPPLQLIAPLPGWTMPLAEVPDPVFSGGMLGDGVAIDPTEGELRAPCDGELLSVAPTGHALTLRADNGAELLLHVGIDTVGLKGRGFAAQATAGNRVRTGDLLLRFDLDALARSAPSLVTPLVVTNADRFEIVRRQLGQRIGRGEFLMELRAKATPPITAHSPADAGVTRRLRVGLAHGIHARPAAQIVHAIREFDAEVAVTAHGRRASARSAVSLMSLGVTGFDEIAIEGSGPGARAALDAVARILGGDGSSAPVSTVAPAGAVAAPATPPAGAEFPGVTAAGGVAIGTAAPLARRERVVDEAGRGPARESAQLASACSMVRASLAARANADGPAAEIAAAHLEFLDDPSIAATAAGWIDRGKSAGFAWRSAIRASVDALRDLADPRLAERADDLIDLETQVLAALAGETPSPGGSLPARAILIADELLPSELVSLDAVRIAGICTARGGPTSHVAILAAAMGKPMLVGAGTGILGIRAGTPLLLDADRGVLTFEPPAAQIAGAERAIRHRRQHDAAEREAAGADCTTADGVRIEVLANIGAAAEAAEAVASGAEGCGLLRTEFLFLDRRTAPDARHQAAEYQRVVDAFAGRPVVIRTLDVGDDKRLPYLDLPREDNPALGLRGVRLGFARPALLRAQLEAVLAVRPIARCRLMLPMVQEPAEIERVRELLEEVADGLGIAGRPALGAMIETPSAAVIADRICEVADFVSIGTNDLTQYALAMDRAHPDLATRQDALHPAVLRLVAATAQAATAAGRPVAVCGGLAGDSVAVPVLLGLGVHELSVVPRAIPHIKALVRGLTLARCRELAREALTLPSAAAVRAMLHAAAGGGSAP